MGKVIFNNLHPSAITFPLGLFNWGAVNLTTYRRGPTSQGNIACSKRDFERIFPEVWYTTDKFMNLYNPVGGRQLRCLDFPEAYEAASRKNRINRRES